MSSHSHTHTHGAGAHDHSSEDHDHGHSHVAQGGADHTGDAHGHSGDSTAAANRAHYDERAAEQSKTKAFIDLANRNAPYILGQYAFEKESTTVLDFACGTGLTSRSVAPHAKRVVGVDISPVSIEHYNKFAQEAGYTPEQMHGLTLELKGEPGELDGATFDVVVCSMAYHHMDDINRITRVLERFVKPGGALIIVDLNATPEGKEIVKEEYHHVVPHAKGFTEAQIRQTFEGVGLTSFVFKDAGSFEWEDKHLDLFVAKGIKPNTA